MNDIIIYELNEVPIKLFNHYANAFPKSAFACLLRDADLYETRAADIGDLSPWISWPTFHRGASNVLHGISDLSQDLARIDLDYPPIWHLLSNAGIKVGLFGSLQSYPLPKNIDNYSFYIPDTFASGPETFPKNFMTYQSFNLGMTGVNGRNVVSKVLLKEAANFVLRAPFMGLSTETAFKLAYQLIAEKFNPDRIVRRRSSQAEIAFDLFYTLQKKFRPNISFFFTNHLASSMHRYWPTIFPEDYTESKFDSDWLRKWHGEIPHSVKVANNQLARLITNCRANNVKLIVASSMGQAAVDGSKLISKQALISDVSALLGFLGIERDEWQPRLSMAPRVVVRPKSANFHKKLSRLDQLLVCGQKINVELLSTGDIRFDVYLFNEDILDVEYAGSKIEAANVGLQNVDLQDAAGSNAYHIPEGVLLVYDSKKKKNFDNNRWKPISVLDVAPSLLDYFGVAKLNHMNKKPQISIA